jgi:hypothetical protein
VGISTLCDLPWVRYNTVCVLNMEKMIRELSEEKKVKGKEYYIIFGAPKIVRISSKIKCTVLNFKARMFEKIKFLV